MTEQDIIKAIDVLKAVQYVWADQIPNDNQLQSDYDAITQSIVCLKEYKEVINH